MEKGERCSCCRIPFFWNKHQRRYRSGTRIAIAAAVIIPASLVQDIVTTLALAQSDVIVSVAEVVGALVFVTTTIGTIAACCRYLDGRFFRSLGMHPWGGISVFMRLFAGSLAGIVGVVGMVLLLMAGEFLLNFKWEPSIEDPTECLLSFCTQIVVFLAMGFAEELIFRGYILRNLLEGFSSSFINPQEVTSQKLVKPALFAACISSLVWASLHLFPPHKLDHEPAMIAVALIEIFCYGFLFSLVVIKTNSLVEVTMMHVCWNVAQTTIFGFGSARVQLWKPNIHGSPFVTGGSFGPEGGAFGPFGIMISIFVLLALESAYAGEQRQKTWVNKQIVREGIFCYKAAGEEQMTNIEEEGGAGGAGGGNISVPLRSYDGGRLLDDMDA